MKLDKKLDNINPIITYIKILFKNSEIFEYTSPLLPFKYDERDISGIITHVIEKHHMPREKDIISLNLNIRLDQKDTKIIKNAFKKLIIHTFGIDHDDDFFGDFDKFLNSYGFFENISLTYTNHPTNHTTMEVSNNKRHGNIQNFDHLNEIYTMPKLLGHGDIYKYDIQQIYNLIDYALEKCDISNMNLPKGLL